MTNYFKNNIAGTLALFNLALIGSGFIYLAQFSTELDLFINQMGFGTALILIGVRIFFYNYHSNNNSEYSRYFSKKRSYNSENISNDTIQVNNSVNAAVITTVLT